jgi:predicted short-subunit dehydrogenase-like oxidoreductase (DUF2520 family)
VAAFLGANGASRPPTAPPEADLKLVRRSVTTAAARQRGQAAYFTAPVARGHAAFFQLHEAHFEVPDHEKAAPDTAP